MTDDNSELSQEEKEQQAKQLREMGEKYKEEHVQELEKRVNDLTALLYQVVNHFENEFFNNQSMLRAIRDRLIMTPEIWEIVNKSKQAQEQPNS